MWIFLKNHALRFEVEQTALMLLPEAKPRAIEGVPDETEEEYGVSSVSVTEKGVYAGFFLRYRGKETEKTCRHTFSAGVGEDERQAQIRHAARRAAFLAITELTGEKPAWGVLSGVRPAKLARSLLAEMPPDAVEKTLRTRFFLSAEKAGLAAALAAVAARAAQSTKPGDAAVYLGIPFCPSRCAYCSFVSGAAASEETVSRYLENLLREIAETGRRMTAGGARVRALYVGGGTPTVLSAGQLAALLAAARRAFPLDAHCEITVEAGRPDTMTAEKIEALRDGGVGRVSINPQSFSDAVLAAARRRHTAAEAVAAFHLVREIAPRLRINMDFIAGLPLETAGTFAQSLETAVSLAPDNLTVHTLARKRGAAWAGETVENHTKEALAAMLSAGQAILARAGYRPYYLYRQKYMGGSFENVGYERGGTPCLYNLYMMEELLPVVACGASATTKLVAPAGRFRRMGNPKYPDEYARNLTEILVQKAEIEAFFRSSLA